MDARVREMVEAQKAAIRETRKELKNPSLHEYVARVAELEVLLEDIQKHPILVKSDPPFDMEYLEIIRAEYTITQIREKLNKMNRWMVSNPSKVKNRKNFRRLLNHFLNDFKNVYINQGKNE
jgi:hypothetical protein